MILRILLLFSLVLSCLETSAADRKAILVYKVDIKEEIGPEIWRLADKSFREAEKEGADYILIHMNTYGGMVVYADSLRSRILNYPKPVWVFIDNNAASAGALISIACDKIFMREGASIGAATVVNQTGEAMPDKYQSYMRSMIRATAQAHGRDTVMENGKMVCRWKRDPRIAEAMVDQTIYIEGVSDSGRIVTFTPHEAMKYGYCDAVAGSIDELLDVEGLSGCRIKEYRATVMDRLIGFLINPVVRGLVIMLIIGGIYFELQTPGVGFPLAAAFLGCLLYFAPLYLEGLASHWEVAAFLAGILLLVLEIFVIPGFGIAGAGGIVLVTGALVFAGIDRFSFEFMDGVLEALLGSLLVVISSSLFSLGMCMWLGSRILGSRRWPFALHAQQKADDGYVGVDLEIGEVVGRMGVCITDLRPSGKVSVDGEIYDAVSQHGAYVEKGCRVAVTGFQSGQIYVEPCLQADPD